MKNIFLFTFFAGLALLSACSDPIDPTVETIYFNTEKREAWQSQAIGKLYEHYSNSDKSKEYYEVAARKAGNYILNYYPSGKLLTVCEDPGSGWSGQYTNVDEAALQNLAQLKISLDSMQLYVIKDSIIGNSASPYVQVKSNVYPY
jgi:hypothetical protein